MCGCDGSDPEKTLVELGGLLDSSDSDSRTVQQFASTTFLDS